MAELDPQMDHKGLVDDLAQHVMDQVLPPLHRALNIVPDGFEAALVLRFFFKCVSMAAETLPFESWKTMSPESRVRALVKILEVSLQGETAFEISNQEIRVIPKRAKRGH
jgi:hypothetical protein